jgi:hypothetical protein
LTLAGGAFASTGGAATDVQSQNVSPRHEIFLGEEEISDVSLSTFYVFDKESAKPQLGEKVAWWRGCRCGGCHCRRMRMRLEGLRWLRLPWLPLRRMRITATRSDYLDECRSVWPA